jgi:soluble lytic murein transglycosylase-like protein
MNKERKIRFEFLIVGIILGGVLIWAGIFCYNQYMDARLEFIKQFTSESVAIELLRFSDMYEFNFIDVMACIESESRFKIMAYSKAKCKGLMQISPVVHQHSRGIARKYYDFKDIDPYSIEYNLWSGIHHWSGLLEYTKGDILKSVNLYNMGFRRYWKGEVNYSHVTKFNVNKREFKKQWRKFNKILR